MANEILTTIKQMLDLVPTETIFDQQLSIFIDESILTLKKLNVIPEENNVLIAVSTVWDDLGISPNFLGSAKTYIYLSTRLLFDPPTNGNYKEVLEKKVRELEQRFSMYEVVEEEPILEEEE